MRRLQRFAYAPRPLPDELLGGWVQRVAIRHGVSGPKFVGWAKDIDWAARPELLRFLSAGAGVPMSTFEDMLLCRREGARRYDFALADGGAFPGGHAFCPLCAIDDQRRHGAVILRASNAGLWAISCPVHRCYLDSVEGSAALQPGAYGNADGAIRPPNWTEAPAIALAFERAAARAVRRQDPGPLWRVREPRAFLDAAADWASLLLLRAGPAQLGSHGLHALLGQWQDSVDRYGSQYFDAGWLYRMGAWVRVRSLTGAALMLAQPSAVERIGWPAWPSRPLFAKDGATQPCPWRVATRYWAEDTADQARRLAATWPAGLASELRETIWARMKAAGHIEFIRTDGRWAMLHRFLKAGLL